MYGILLILFLIIVPALPIVLLFLSRTKELDAKKKFIKTAFVTGILPYIYVINVLILSTHHGNYGGLFILFVIIPWLIIRPVAYLILRNAAGDYLQGRQMIFSLLGIDTVMLMISVITVSGEIAH
jgi:hypothetical protein